MIPVSAALVAFAVPPEPDVGMVVEESAPSGDLREELRALREELEAERRQRREMLDELRRSRAPREAPRPARSTTRMGEPAVVARGEEVDDVVAFASDVLVDGVVRGSATAFGGDVIIRPSGVVHGDAVSFGGRVVVEDGASLHGDRVALESAGPNFVTSDDDAPESWPHWLYRRTMLLLSLAGAGVLVVGLFPSRVQGVAGQIGRHPVSSAFLGAAFSSLIVVFCALFALLTLGLGAPVSAVGLGLLGAAWLLGFVSVCQVIGDNLPLDPPNGRWAALLTCSFLFAFSDAFGFGGTLLTLFLSLAGIGAALFSRFGSNGA